ncbi:hypothetical protein [Aeromonas caviae]|uniref:Uncharacterized protein n=1 Tax=Aeromonas caviae TaxID=648 RepID=A0AAJ5ZDA2_AERCA|nr:hypothetical protein [Aeromonas caviae]RWT81302.1 hypothetical protein DN604_00605 [Aeromonas caviae]WFG00380.1 hypothetical protein P5S46_21695 [Aeromonas caviae]
MNCNNINGSVHTEIEKMAIGLAAMSVLYNVDDYQSGYQAYCVLAQSEGDFVPDEVFPSQDFETLSSQQLVEHIEGNSCLFKECISLALTATKRTLVALSIDATLDSDANSWDLQEYAEKGLVG